MESWNILVESMIANSDDSIPRFAHQIAITLINKESDCSDMEVEEKRAKCLTKLFLKGSDKIRGVRIKCRRLGISLSMRRAIID